MLSKRHDIKLTLELRQTVFPPVSSAHVYRTLSHHNAPGERLPRPVEQSQFRSKQIFYNISPYCYTFIFIVSVRQYIPKSSGITPKSTSSLSVLLRAGISGVDFLRRVDSTERETSHFRWGHDHRKKFSPTNYFILNKRNFLHDKPVARYMFFLWGNPSSDKNSINVLKGNI